MTDPARDSPVESAWTKLRRRKVVQWGVAYAAGAWGLLQGAQFVSEIFNWPGRALQLGTVAALIGLPVVLVLAWYHGDRVEFAIVTLLFLIGGGLFWRYHNSSEAQVATTTSSASSEPVEAIADPRPSIAAALKATLTADEKTRLAAIPTQNLEAWEAYQLGKQRMARRTSEVLAEAERFFREAIERDPKFALAHVGLADALTLQVDYGGKPAEATLAEAEATLAKAFQLDPNLAEAWASSGSVAQARAQDDTAERAFRRAIELNPNYAPAHQWLSLTLRNGTRLQEEHEHAQRAVDLDPLSAITVLNLGHTLERLGRFDEAATRCRRVIEIDPQFPPVFSSLADLQAHGRNRFVEAMPLLERAVALDAGNPRDAASLALLRYDLGDIAEATQLIAALVDRWPDDLYVNAVAGIAAELSGDDEAAERHGRAALNAYSRVAPPLATLRNIDLRKGEAAAAHSRYTSAYPELLRTDGPRVDAGNYQAAIDVALVLQSLAMLEPAQALLDGGERAIRSLPRLGWSSYGISDVQIHALRDAEKAGWRGPGWRYYRDVDPNLASIRNEPEFKVVFADIERDMARQRAELAARPKDAPLELGSR